MENCPHCAYTSSRRYNLDRHIAKMHKTPPKVPQSPPKVPHPPPKVPQPPPNVSQPPPNVSAKPSCELCGKIFARSDNLLKHKARCTGVASSLECPNCHTIFNSKQSKCRHVKTCAPVAVATVNSHNTHSSHNTTTNSHNTNTVNNTNNNTVHVHINNFGEERMDYLTNEFITACFENGVNGVRTVLDKIYFNQEHPENHNVKLRSLNHAIAEVYKDHLWIPNGLHETIERMILQAAIKITSTIASITEPTEDNMKALSDINGIDKSSKKRMIESAIGRLLARRDKEESK